MKITEEEKRHVTDRSDSAAERERKKAENGSIKESNGKKLPLGSLRLGHWAKELAHNKSVKDFKP